MSLISFISSHPLDADLAPAHPRPEVSGLESLRHGLAEHGAAIDGGEPEGELVGKVVAGAAAAAALYERRRAEVFQAGTGTRQKLPPALCSGGSVLKD